MGSQMTLMSSLTSSLMSICTDTRGEVAGKVGELASLAPEITDLTHLSCPPSSVSHARDVI